MLETYITIWALHTLAMLSPGPNFVLVIQSCLSGGFSAVVHVALGIALSASFWATYALLGVDYLLSRYPIVYTVMSGAGLLFLSYLGLRLWFKGASAGLKYEEPLPRKRLFWLGLATNLSNLKSMIFFGAIFSVALPEDVDVKAFIATVILIVFNSFMVNALIGLLVSKESIRKFYLENDAAINRVFAIMILFFVGVGCFNMKPYNVGI